VTCPVCRAANAATATACRRCKADLTLVAATLRAARDRAVAALRRRDFPAAWAAYQSAKGGAA
jgi:hypothetical protein